MSKKIIKTKTFDFDRMLLQQAERATHPAAIAPLIRMARQAGGRGTVRALRRIEKDLVKIEAAGRKKLKAAERKAARAYAEPAVTTGKPAGSCTGASVLMDDGSVIAWDPGGPIGGYSIQN